MKTILIPLFGVALLLGACTHTSSNTATPPIVSAVDTTTESSASTTTQIPSTTTQALISDCNITDGSTVLYADDVMCITDARYFFTETALATDGDLRLISTHLLSNEIDSFCNSLTDLSVLFNVTLRKQAEYTADEINLPAYIRDDFPKIMGTTEYSEADGQCYFSAKKLIWLAIDLTTEPIPSTSEASGSICAGYHLLFTLADTFILTDLGDNFIFNWHNEDMPFNFCYVYVNPA